MKQQRKEDVKLLPHLIVSLLFLIEAAASQSIVKTLPGYSGTLPFKLETGYISVGENDEVEMFYYFIESERYPQKDPVVLWLTGGPGCSGFSGLVYEIGPLAFDFAAFDGNLPSVVVNPYSWTKIANFIFIDSPAGTGFSYATTSQGYNNSDTRKAKYDYLFLKKWLLNHPKFLYNRVYIAGDSYGGKIVPMVALEIARGNEAGHEPLIFLQGYIVGNPLTDPNMDDNEQIPYAHRMALLSDEYFEQAKSSCHGQFVNPDPNNVQCLSALQIVNQCLDPVNAWHILEPKCHNFTALKSNGFHLDQLRFLGDDPVDIIFLSEEEPEWCRSYNYVTSYVWANDPAVQEALHVRKGTITDWKRCNRTISYDKNVGSVVKYHRHLSERGFQALAYSGDHDMVVPYLGTLKWIKYLNLTLDEEWRPWTVDGQVAGYTEKYKNNQASLTFATVKGAGHTPPEYYPKECFAMFERWLSDYPL